MLRCTMAEGSEHEDLEIDADCEETHAINLSFVVSKCSRAPRTCLSCGKPLQKIGHARKNGAKRNVIFSAHRAAHASPKRHRPAHAESTRYQGRDSSVYVLLLA